MNNVSDVRVDNATIILKLISCLFGVGFLAIGLINTFWGNDPGFGIFIILLSLLYFPPVATWYQKIIGRPLPVLLKIMVGLFIIWSALGVGELFDKIELMKSSF